MAREPSTPEMIQRLHYVIEKGERILAEREAAERRPFNRIVRAWAALTGADLPPRRRFR